MASPQQENGHIRIANELWEALIKIRIPGEARQCLDFIIRKTWGFGKKIDQIALSQFVLGTGIKSPNIVRALIKLSEMNLVSIIRKDNGNSYIFNKDFDTWKPLSKQIIRGKALSEAIMPIIRSDNGSLSEKIRPIIRKDKKPLSEAIHTITNKTIIKTTVANATGLRPDNRDPIIQDLWEFGISNGFSNLKQRGNRFALKRMLKNKNPIQLKKACLFSQQVKNENYAPQVYNWMDLEEKYLKLRNWVVRTQKQPKSKGIEL